ncbi:MAG: hypothetical protein CTY20_05670 [Hyphomicrobium sp.]|nr:MAG: hypothetical protein CTY20_05670 [Hyphomicrobium sp.]
MNGKFETFFIKFPLHSVPHWRVRPSYAQPSSARLLLAEPLPNHRNTRRQSVVKGLPDDGLIQNVFIS